MVESIAKDPRLVEAALCIRLLLSRELLPEAGQEAGGEAPRMWLPSSRPCLQPASLSEREGQQQGC